MATAHEQYEQLLSVSPGLAAIYKSTHGIQLFAEVEQARKANAPAAPAVQEIPSTPSLNAYERLKKRSVVLGEIYQLIPSHQKRMADEEAALDAALLAIPPDKLEEALAARAARERAK